MELTSEYIQQVLSEKCQVEIGALIIVAVSGGADSMAILHLLNMNYDVVAAHCNFKLRGDDSDRDEELVTRYCEENNIKLLKTRFETQKYAQEQGISIEMAARDLRYNWFNELLQSTRYDVIATGHHGNDSIETFFLNLVRGTGLKGLSGINYRNGNVVRPLLGLKRKEIEYYCEQHGIAYCHDASNDDTKFTRNKIRHEIIPVLEDINPSFFETMLNNMTHLKDAETMLEYEVARFKATDMVDEDDKVIIPISKLENYPHFQTILFNVLHAYGFGSAQVAELIKHLHGTSGKQFFSASHRLIKDRHNILVLPKTMPGVDHFWVEEGMNDSELKLELSTYAKPKDFKFSRDAKLIHLDADQIDLPLLVRKWEQGDAFMPLGMNGFKKVSDFFIDEKYSLKDKEDAWLMISGEAIVWIIGKRIDDRFKVTTRTKNILEIKLT